jgi:hypothetical protein
MRSCIECGALLKCEDIRAAGPFPCPTCHRQLQAPASYGRWIALGSLLVPAVAFGALGFGGLHLLFAVLLSWLPIDCLALNLVKYAILPRIEIYAPNDTTLRLRNGPRL